MDDALRTGDPLGWGTFAPDHNHLGLLIDGPQPAQNPLAKYIAPVTPDPSALPPGLARLCLTLTARRSVKLKSVLHRQSLPTSTTPPRRLKPLVLGRNRG